MSRRGIAVLLAAVVVSGCAATPSASARVAPSARSLGKVLTRVERQTYRCGPRWREDRPVRAFVTKPHERFRLVPRRLLKTRRHVVLRCAFARPHAVRVAAPVAVQADPAPVAPARAPVQAAPVVEPAPVSTSTCGDEIGDPTRVPLTSGLRPANQMDVYDPSPEVRQATLDPMTYWNEAPNRVTDDGHLLVTFSDGREYIHPVGSFNFALASLRQYRLTGDPVWLDRAVTSYGDPLAGATPDGQIPQEFPWPGPEGQIMSLPAYSAMAQGEALSIAVRLYRITGEQRYRDLADKMFATLATPGTASPSVTFIDTDGYLWFEEFPLECPGRIWNGHVFATFAMADYYWLTGNQRALELFDAGATTALHYMPQIRRPGQICNYNVSHVHPVTDLWYHRMMTNQLRYLAQITGAQAFTDWADLLAQDAS